MGLQGMIATCHKDKVTEKIKRRVLKKEAIDSLTARGRKTYDLRPGGKLTLGTYRDVYVEGCNRPIAQNR